MSDRQVKVYDADHGAQAEMLREALADADIPAFVEDIPSPLDGLTSMGQGTPIFVDEDHATKARQVIERFFADRSESDDD